MGKAWCGADSAADGAFAGDGYVELGLEPGVPQTLKLIVRGERFDVLVNDKTVVQDVPAGATQGWIALTSFRGPVTFENVQITLGSVVK